MRRKCFVLLAVSLLATAFSLCAQTHYKVQDLISATLSNLPQLKQKQALANAAKAGITDVQHSLLPKLLVSEQLDVGSNNSMAGTYFGMGITPSTSAGVRAANDYNPVTGNIGVLYSEYELINFGLNKAKLNYARSNAGLYNADLKRDQYISQLETARLWFALLKSQYRLEADKQNVERYQTIYNIIHALAGAGLVAGADSSLAIAELSKNKILFNQTLGSQQQLQQQLAFYSGIDATKIYADSITSSIDGFSGAGTDSAYNPLTDFYQQRKNLLLANETLIKKTFQPKIMLMGAVWARGSRIQYNDDFKTASTGLGYQRFNYLGGLAFTYNLFNGLYKKDKLRINALQTQAGDFELQQQQAMLNTSLAQANNKMAIAKANLAEIPLQINAARATFAQKTAQYKAGLISLIDLTNASFVLYRSQIDYTEAFADWWLARLDMAAYTGTLDSFIQSIK